MKQAFLTILVLSVLFLPMAANAEKPPDYNDSLKRMDAFMNNVTVVLNNVLADSDLNSFVNALWNALTIILLFTAFAKYSMGVVSVYELIHPLLLILITRIMLNNGKWSEAYQRGFYRKSGYHERNNVVKLVKSLQDAV